MTIRLHTKAGSSYSGYHNLYINKDMTITDFNCLLPLLIIAAAPLILMGTVSVFRHYNVVFGISVFFFVIAFLSIFAVIPFVPHNIGTLFIIDIYSLLFAGIIIISGLLVALLSFDYIKLMEGAREEYYIILFTATLGALLLSVAGHFIILFLGIETLSLSLYVMISYQRARDNSIEAGLKYLILASVSSAILLFGMGLIYTASGTMKFSEVAAYISSTAGPMSPVVLAGFGLIVVGLGFKLALVPFHMWTPDVYQGSPSPVSAFIATASKGGAMAVLIRFFFYIKGFSYGNLFILVSCIAVLSMFVGNLLAVRQQNIKRLLGYSSIANMGYLIIMLLTGTTAGIHAAVFYMAAYFITTIGAFGIIAVLSTGNGEPEDITDYRGLFWKKPWVAAVLTLSFLSLAGIPVTAGFIGKFYIILEGINTGLILLVFSLIINSVIGLYYYLRVITSLFSPVVEGVNLPAITVTGGITLAIITAGILLLGIYPGWLFDAIEKFAAFN
ncbi:MAG: NADH-quinone oxidoreductase subunit N [Bacteroidales bacterium]